MSLEMSLEQLTSGMEVCRHQRSRATFLVAAMTCDISRSGSAVRHGKHLNAGTRHHRPRLVNTYVSDRLRVVKSWHADILAYTSDKTCTGVS